MLFPKSSLEQFSCTGGVTQEKKRMAEIIAEKRRENLLPEAKKMTFLSYSEYRNFEKKS